MLYNIVGALYFLIVWGLVTLINIPSLMIELSIGKFKGTGILQSFQVSCKLLLYCHTYLAMASYGLE